MPDMESKSVSRLHITNKGKRSHREGIFQLGKDSFCLSYSTLFIFCVFYVFYVCEVDLFFVIFFL